MENIFNLLEEDSKLSDITVLPSQIFEEEKKQKEKKKNSKLRKLVKSMDQKVVVVESDGEKESREFACAPDTCVVDSTPSDNTAPSEETPKQENPVPDEEMQEQENP